MNTPPLDPLDRLRASHASHIAGEALQEAQRLDRCAKARGFGVLLATDHLTWAQVLHYRNQAGGPRPGRGWWSRADPQVVGVEGLTFSIECRDEWEAFASGVELVARTIEAQHRATSI